MILLAIDPGKVSGWAVVDAEGAALAAGEARSPEDRAHAIRVGKGHVRALHSSLVVIREHWQGTFRKDRSSARTIAGLGASWGRWAEQLELARHPRRRIVSVGQSTWRAAILRGGACRTTPQWKAAAKAFAVTRWPQLAAVWHESPDACEAACLGLYGTKAPEVFRVALKREGL